MRYLRTIPLVLAVLIAAAVFVACGDDDEGNGGNGGEATTRAAASPTEDEGEDGSPTDGADGEAIELELTAENITYDETELTAPAGADVTLIFDNDDEGIQHNFALFETPESEDPIFPGDIITGVDTINYEFTAPEDPGTYHFHCQVHPTQMEGEFIVE